MGGGKLNMGSGKLNMGTPWTLLEPSWGHLCAQLGPFGRSWDNPEVPGVNSGLPLEQLGLPWGPIWTPFWFIRAHVALIRGR